MPSTTTLECLLERNPIMSIHGSMDNRLLDVIAKSYKLDLLSPTSKASKIEDVLETPANVFPFRSNPSPCEHSQTTNVDLNHSTTPWKEKYIKFWNADPCDETRAQLIDSIVQSSSFLPTFVLQRILDEVISHPSFPEYGSSDDEEVMSLRTVISELSDIDDRIFGRKPTVELPRDINVKSIGRGSLSASILSSAQQVLNDLFTLPCDEADTFSQSSPLTQTSETKISTINTQIDIKVENGSLNISPNTKDTGGNRNDIHLMTVNNLAYDKPCDSSSSQSFEKLVSLANRMLSWNSKNTKEFSKQEIPSPSFPSNDEAEYTLSLRALGMNQSESIETLELAYTKETIYAPRKDPFPDDLDFEECLPSPPFPSINQSESFNSSSNDDSLVIYEEGPLFASRRNSAILIIEIPRTSTRKGMSQNLAMTKSLLSLIINEATLHGGDVLQWTEDTVYVEWTSLNSERVQAEGVPYFSPASCGECTIAAALCASKVISLFSALQSKSPKSTEGISVSNNSFLLDVKCSIGVGHLICLHLCTHESQREYVFFGEALSEAIKASRMATGGQVLMSGLALKELSTVCTLHHKIANLGHELPQVIADRSGLFFKDINVRATVSCTGTRESLFQALRRLPLLSLQLFQDTVSSYVSSRCATSITELTSDPEQCSKSEAKHLDTHYLLSIAPQVPLLVTGDNLEDEKNIVLLNDVMTLVQREARKFHGSLRQVFVNGAGLVFIVSFQRHDSQALSTGARFAIPAAISIHNCLLQELAIQNKIGASFGKSYFGLVLGEGRQGFLLAGPPVTFSQMLMKAKENPGILVDNYVRKMSEKSVSYNVMYLLDPKGTPSSFPVFEPLSPLNRSWGYVRSNFVGRKLEIWQMMVTAREAYCNSLDPPRVIYLQGDQSSGKSSTLILGLEHIRRTMKTNQREILMIRQPCRFRDRFVPFGTIAGMLWKIMTYKRNAMQTGPMIAEKIAPSPLQIVHLDKLLSAQIHDTPSDVSFSLFIDTLRQICIDINVPANTTKLTIQLLTLNVMESLTRNKFKQPIPEYFLDEIVTIMCQIFSHLTSTSRLKIVALDDSSNIDKYSWMVIQKLFQSEKNLLFLITGIQVPFSRSKIGISLWNSLCQNHTLDRRFNILRLSKLSLEEVKILTLKTIGFPHYMMGTPIIEALLFQANGCPGIIDATLDVTKHLSPDLIQTSAFIEDDRGAFKDLEKLFSFRISSLQSKVLQVIEIMAILGSSFPIKKIISFVSFLSQEKGDFRDMIQALETAIGTGIVFLSKDVTNDETNDYYHSCAAVGLWSPSIGSKISAEQCELENLTCNFSNNIWRSTALRLMPDSKLRDLHKSAALWLQHFAQEEKSSLFSWTSLFSHWKESNCYDAATDLALRISKSYEQLGMHDVAADYLLETLGMWFGSSKISCKEDFFKLEKLDLFSIREVELLLQLLNSLARLDTLLGRSKESIMMYHRGLKVICHIPTSENWNREIGFPIFLGLFSAIECGLILDDKTSSFEMFVAAKFVQETSLFGDTMHHALALAMEAMLYARLGMFEKAALIHLTLVSLYNPKKHSIYLSKMYGSDRVAQCFGQSVEWYLQLEEPDGALEVCLFVQKCLLPIMDRRDIQNTMLTIYPIIWVLKEHGHEMDARQIFEIYILNAIPEGGKDNSFNAFQPIFKPIQMLLDLSSGLVAESDRQTIVDWVLNEEITRFSLPIDCMLGRVARPPSSILAEICLLLATEHSIFAEVSKLVRIGFSLLLEMLLLAKENQMYIAKSKVLPLLQRLKDLAARLGIEIPVSFEFDASICS